MGRVFSNAHYLPQNKISNLEVSLSNPGVVVLGHEVLVPCKSLFSCCLDLVQ